MMTAASWPRRVAPPLAIALGLVTLGMGLATAPLDSLTHAAGTGTHILGKSSPVAVAVSTLVAAALFNPLRRRVQDIVDRRFNRARYDADQTVRAFAARLKDAVDLDAVRDDLAATAERALEPAHLSVWVSGPPGSARVSGEPGSARRAAQ